MKPTKEQMEDQLMDALLHEQNRPDKEQSLQAIEAAIQGMSFIAPANQSHSWRNRLGLAAAAMLAIGVGVVVHQQQQKESVSELALLSPTTTPLDREISRTVAAEYPATLHPSASPTPQPQIKLPIPSVPSVASESNSAIASLGNEYKGKSLEGKILDELTEESGATDGDVTKSKSLALNNKSSAIAPPVESPGSATEALKRDALKPSASLSRNGIGGGGGFGGLPAAETNNTERYGPLIDPTWKTPSEYPLSTFSIDVDNASYSNIRRMIRDGQQIPTDAVRIEECINAFDYAYAKPEGDKAFAVHSTLATCPWNEQHMLLKVGIKGREISAAQRPASNLVFLIDVSGSMQDSRKLPLVKESLKLLLHQLDERDRVSYVVYAGSEGVVLPPTKMTESGRTLALTALDKLEAGGSTNGGAGIKRAYQLALENFVAGGVNRVILASDGDFNVGITNQQALVDLVKERAAKNVYLSILSFGTGNLNDSLMEAISKDGNGNYYYIDSIREGRKVFLQRLSGTLITIAKDVKIQIEFNPQKVGSYRLIGYANRVLKDEDFNNDKVDAGDIGAGHRVTAFYEIVGKDQQQPNAGGIDDLKYQKAANADKLGAADADPSDEWLTLKLRHKSAEGDVSSLEESIVKGPAKLWQESGDDFVFASTVALFGMKLRGMDEGKAFTWARLHEFAIPATKNDPSENRAEFVEMLKMLDQRSR